MTTNSLIKIDRQSENVATITLNRPDKRNALSIALMQSFCAELARLSDDGKCRVAIIAGAGPVFCAGLDLCEASETELAARSAACVAQTFNAVTDSPMVTIAAAHGAAIAGGAGLMSVCDFVVAADDLRISFPEVRRGLVPALVAAVLTDRLRDADLRQLFLLAETIDAKRAQQIGLVNRVVAADAVRSESLLLANEILLAAPEAIRLTKQLLCELRGLGPSERTERALALHQHARASGEAMEGLAAFRQGRQPKY